MVVLALAIPATAHADIFAFKDLGGFEKCMQTDHVVDSVTTDKGTQARYLGPGEIQARCVDSAVKLLTPLNKPVTDLEFVVTTRRLSSTLTAIDLVGVLAGHSLAGCNELAAYEVLIEGLSRPKDTLRTSPFTRARAIARRCLDDKAFRTDFLEEKDRSGTELAINACELLLEKKLVTSCKGRP